MARVRMSMKLVFLILTVLFVKQSFHEVCAALNEGNGMRPHACSNVKHKSYSFCNERLPIRVRVHDLLRRLTLEEKVQQLINTAPAIPRLSIPNYEWWSEALHGISNTGPGVSFSTPVPAAVSFPQVILTAASFNTTLWKNIGQVVSTEGRAMFNLGRAGLTYWSPNVNIYRDPRWGRGQETPGEDPLVTSQYAVNYVRGLEEAERGHPHRKKVAACCKHFNDYDLDNWTTVDRFHFNAQVTQQDDEDTFKPPFKSCVQKGDVSCVMCSYNRINGVPACVDKDLLRGTVRKEWGFKGYIASDCDSVEVLYNQIRNTPTPEDAVAKALIAGLNLNCGTYLANYTVAAIRSGKVSEALVDESLSYTYATLMKLGFFDSHPEKQLFGKLGEKNVCADDHRELAVEAARQGIVLLKNQDDFLPLSQKKVKRLAVIGPNANATMTMIGNYAGIPCKYTSPLQGLKKYAEKVYYQPGCLSVKCMNDSSSIKKAVEVSKKADAVVMVMGLDQTEEREGCDRTCLLLPGEQEMLIKEVVKSSKGKVVLVIMSGGSLDISFAKENSGIHSILWVGYPGEAGGQAIAEVIFGDHNPGGRLPMTWYPENYTRIPMTDMHMRANPRRGYPGRSYRFYQEKAVYEFGHGLSYTKFSTKFSNVPQGVHLHATKLAALRCFTSPHCHAIEVKELQCHKSIFRVEVEVKNGGRRSGDEVVLLYSHPAIVHEGVPIKQLIAFKRVHVEAGKTKVVEFILDACEHLSTVNESGKKVVGIAKHGLSLGDGAVQSTLKVGYFHSFIN